MDWKQALSDHRVHEALQKGMFQCMIPLTQRAFQQRQLPGMPLLEREYMFQTHEAGGQVNKKNSGRQLGYSQYPESPPNSPWRMEMIIFYKDVHLADGPMWIKGKHSGKQYRCEGFKGDVLIYDPALIRGGLPNKSDTPTRFFKGQWMSSSGIQQTTIHRDEAHSYEILRTMDTRYVSGLGYVDACKFVRTNKDNYFPAAPKDEDGDEMPTIPAYPGDRTTMARNLAPEADYYGARTDPSSIYRGGRKAAWSTQQGPTKRRRTSDAEASPDVPLQPPQQPATSPNVSAGTGTTVPFTPVPPTFEDRPVTFTDVFFPRSTSPTVPTPAPQATNTQAMPHRIYAEEDKAQLSPLTTAQQGLPQMPEPQSQALYAGWDALKQFLPGPVPATSQSTPPQTPPVDTTATSSTLAMVPTAQASQDTDQVIYTASRQEGNTAPQMRLHMVVRLTNQ